MKTTNTNMHRMRAVIAAFVIVASIIQIGQTATIDGAERLRTLMRRQGGGGGGGGTVSFGGNVGGNANGGANGGGTGGAQGGFSIGANIGGTGGTGGTGGAGGTVTIGGNIGGGGTGGGTGGAGGFIGGLLGSGSGGSGEGGGGFIGGLLGSGSGGEGGGDLGGGVEGGLGGSLNGILDGVSSPVTLSAGILDKTGLDNSPVIGPLSGSVLGGIQTLQKSPGTITNSLSGGLQEAIGGITGAVSSPMTISSQALNNGIEGILSSPLEIVPALSGNVGESLSGILEAASSPLTISGQALDVAVGSNIKSLGGVLPESLQMSLPGSISRGVQALIDSPLELSEYFEGGFDSIIDGIMGSVSSPMKICSAIMDGDLNVNKDSPLIFPEASPGPIGTIAGMVTSPLYLIHALSAQLGLTVSGVLGVVSSPLLLSGEVLDDAFNVDAVSPNMNPEESGIGKPSSFYDGIEGLVHSPLPLSSTMSDSTHLLVDGLLGLATSPISVLCGLSPIPFPGSANTGIGGIKDSPMELADLISGNVGYTLAGLFGLLSSPVTLSANILHDHLNVNGESLNVLPEQLEMWGVPDSIATTVTSFLAVPFDGLTSILGFFSSPLAILDAIGIANVPGSPNSPPIFPLDFPEELPADNLPPYHNNPPCSSGLSGSVDNGPGEASASGYASGSGDVSGSGEVSGSGGGGAQCNLADTSDLGAYVTCLLNNLGVTLNGGSASKPGLISTVTKLLYSLIGLLGLDPSKPGLLSSLLNALSPGN